MVWSGTKDRGGGVSNFFKAFVRFGLAVSLTSSIILLVFPKNLFVSIPRSREIAAPQRLASTSPNVTTPSVQKPFKISPYRYIKDTSRRGRPLFIVISSPGRSGSTALYNMLRHMFHFIDPNSYWAYRDRVMEATEITDQMRDEVYPIIVKTHEIVDQTVRQMKIYHDKINHKSVKILVPVRSPVAAACSTKREFGDSDINLNCALSIDHVKDAYRHMQRQEHGEDLVMLVSIFNKDKIGLLKKIAHFLDVAWALDDWMYEFMVAGVQGIVPPRMGPETNVHPITEIHFGHIAGKKGKKNTKKCISDSLEKHPNCQHAMKFFTEKAYLWSNKIVNATRHRYYWSATQANVTNSYNG